MSIKMDIRFRIIVLNHIKYIVVVQYNGHRVSGTTKLNTHLGLKGLKKLKIVENIFS